jgi:hypothetical protein
VTFKRMFDMSNDSHLFRTRAALEASGHALGEDGRFRGSDGVWERLFEGKMVWFYNHRAADVVKSLTAVSRQNQPSEITIADLCDPNRVALPLYWVLESSVREQVDHARNWFVGFREVTSPTNERTVVSAIIPWSAVGHKLPLLLSSAEAAKVAGLASNLSSLVFDYAARQKVGGTSLGFFIVKQLPVLPPEIYTPALLDLIVPRVLELVYTAWDLEPFARDLGYEGDPFPWDEYRRALLRAELDGLYAHLYGLPRDDFAYILDQFPIVRRKDEASYGEYRTKRLCLEAYDYFAKPAQTALWNAVRDIETRLSQLIVKRLHDDIAAVPEELQAGQEAERLRQRKAARASSLSDLLGGGYLTLLPKVIKANRDAFADLFESNGQVDAHISPLVALRNTLAHTKEAQIADKVRRSGEVEVRWFAEQLGMAIDIVSPPAVERVTDRQVLMS